MHQNLYLYGMRYFLIIVLFNIPISYAKNNQVLYFWSGALTSTSIKVNGVLMYPSGSVRLMVSKSDDFGNPIYSSKSIANREQENTVSLEVFNLEPNTSYYYAFEIDGKPDLTKKHIGSFRTPAKGAFSYRFAVGSCNFFPNNVVYDAMASENPLFYIVTGDLHYANPSSTGVHQHRKAYEERVLSNEREAKFFQKVPLAYVWDDHDFCGDNNIGSDGCGLAAKLAYKEYVPHYPIQAPDSSNAIYQSFSIGRVHFILSDLRAERITGDIMSKTQLTWLKEEIVKARDNGQMIAWITSVSYSGTKSDNWGGFEKTREEFANFLRDEKIENMFILSGDAHMLAIDNGVHTDFSTGNNNPFKYPVFQAAALNNIGSDKGGIFSEGGTYPNFPPFVSQYGIVEVEDNGGEEICIKFHGYRINSFLDTQGELVNYSFCRKLSSSK